LHLVEDGLCRETAHEADRIALGCDADGLVVERHVAVPAWLADGARQRRLAALARPVDQDGWSVAEGLT
jgi:hypothetical protein